ncbi:MAG: NAD-dependent epimerase/dehydratase family protein [Betaproteobacteria bacterium]
MPRSALVAGGSGLVGSKLVDELLADADYDLIHLLVRRRSGRADVKLREHVVDFNTLANFTWPRVADAYSCLGTTIKAAGSQAAFRAVDYDYPLAIAQGVLRRGAQQFLFVSAMGADSRSTVFYSRVKGELESAIAALGFGAAIAFRPSLLAGERAEHRLGEHLALTLLRPVGWLVPAKYRPVADRAVARAMVNCAKRGLAGFHVVTSDAIQAFAPA